MLRGDNLRALKASLPIYAGQIKCIYMAPPYNTGKEGWAYKDPVNSPMFREWLGKTADKKVYRTGRKRQNIIFKTHPT